MLNLNLYVYYVYFYMSAYRRDFDETRYMLFLMKDDKI